MMPHGLDVTQISSRTVPNLTLYSFLVLQGGPLLLSRVKTSFIGVIYNPSYPFIRPFIGVP